MRIITNCCDFRGSLYRRPGPPLKIHGSGGQSPELRFLGACGTANFKELEAHRSCRASSSGTACCARFQLEYAAPRRKPSMFWAGGWHCDHFWAAVKAEADFGGLGWAKPAFWSWRQWWWLVLGLWRQLFSASSGLSEADETEPDSAENSKSAAAGLE